MRSRHLLAVAFLLASFGCGIIGNFQHIYFYPADPAGQRPSLKGTFYVLTGGLEVAAPSGERYAGELSKVSRPQDPSDPFYSEALGFRKQWDLIYGDRYYSKNVMGSARYWRGKLTTPSKACLYVEIIRPDPESDRRLGVATDGQGQVYKITF